MNDDGDAMATLTTIILQTIKLARTTMIMMLAGDGATRPTEIRHGGAYSGPRLANTLAALQTDTLSALVSHFG